MTALMGNHWQNNLLLNRTIGRKSAQMTLQKPLIVWPVINGNNVFWYLQSLIVGKAVNSRCKNLFFMHFWINVDTFHTEYLLLKYIYTMFLGYINGQKYLFWMICLWSKISGECALIHSTLVWLFNTFWPSYICIPHYQSWMCVQLLVFVPEI